MSQDSGALGAYNAFVERHLKRNFWLNVGDGVCFFVSMTFISMETIVPVLVTRLGGSSLIVSLVPFFQTAFMGLGPFLIARHIQQLRLKRPAVVFWGAAMRLSLLVIGVLILTLRDGYPQILLAALILGLVLYFLFGAVSINPYYDLVAKTIPLRVRGRMLSVRSMGGFAAGVVSGVAATKILADLPFPINFGVAFVVGFVFSAISVVLFAFMREEAYPHQTEVVGRREYYRSLVRIIKADRRFIRFVASRAFLILAGAGNVFFAVYAMRKFHLPDTWAGVFTLVGVVSCIAYSPVAGMVGDRFGHKVNLLVALACPALASLVALTATNIQVYCLAFCFTNIMLTCTLVSVMNMTMEYCRPEERPTYVGLSGVMIMPFTFFTLVIGGVADSLGFPVLFGIIAVVSTAGFVYTAVGLEDPTRGRR